MLKLDAARFAILCRICSSPSRFTDLASLASTRTISKHLSEMLSLGLIEKSGAVYNATERGYEVLVKVLDAKLSLDRSEELEKVPYPWLRVLLAKLVEAAREQLRDRLVSLVVYGSAARGTFELGKSDVDLLCVVEDEVEDRWKRIRDLLKRFRLSDEYQICESWLKLRGFIGNPLFSVIDLSKSYALRFQPVYLDMLFHRAVLYDKDRFFSKLLERLRKCLIELGSMRVERADGTWFWILKPGLRPSELIEIDLG